MKLISSIKTVVRVAVLLPWLAACDSWLDVKPVDKVLEEQLYQTETGFKEALNGVYIELNQSSLYGGELMFRMVEILAQRYKISEVGGDKNVVIYKYDDADVEKRINAIWTQAYSLIMNCNLIIKNADARKEIFTADNYNIIKGEALALRAMLHFDLLRLFGPVYKTNPEDISICYNEQFAYSATDLLPASEVIGKIIRDLQTAETMLARDPIIAEGPLASDGIDDDNSLRYRNLRLNYYAVQALMARVYLYAGENQKALETARKVVAVQEQWFPWVKFNDVMLESNKSRDFVFSTELIFALQNRKRGDIFTDYFTSDLDASKLLIPDENGLKNIFANDNDWRYTSMWQVPKDGKFTARCFHKYEQTEELRPHNYLLPMIRMSEMFFIVAETTDDMDEAREVLNRLRRNRGQIPFEENEQIDVKSVVAEEYIREFFGEGQLFYYYKRVNASSIPAGNGGAAIAMDAAKYCLPVPRSETDYRN